MRISNQFLFQFFKYNFKLKCFSLHFKLYISIKFLNIYVLNAISKFTFLIGFKIQLILMTFKKFYILNDVSIQFLFMTFHLLIFSFHFKINIF